jgi:hypothetical protein
LVAGSYTLSGYDVASGKEIWWIKRLPWQVKPTPVVAGDMVFFTTFSAESDPGEQEIVPPYSGRARATGSQQDGKLSKDEIVDTRARARFEEYLDLDDSGFLEEHDWDQYRERRLGESALRPTGWAARATSRRVTCYGSIRGRCPTSRRRSCIATCCTRSRKAASSLRSTARPARSSNRAACRRSRDYYASPVAADGKIYTASEEGKVAVIQPGPQWQVTKIIDMGDGIKATLAPVDGRIYLRTYGALYCFAKK